MKTIFFLTVILIGSLMASCEGVREKTAEELLDNSKMREEIYSAILNDSIYFNTFLGKAMSNKSSKKILTENYSMMKMMCMSDNMDHIMNTDKEAMERMSAIFIKKLEQKHVSCDKTCVRYLPIEHYNKCLKEQMCSPMYNETNKSN